MYDPSTMTDSLEATLANPLATTMIGPATSPLLPTPHRRSSSVASTADAGRDHYEGAAGTKCGAGGDGSETRRTPIARTSSRSSFTPSRRQGSVASITPSTPRSPTLTSTQQLPLKPRPLRRINTLHTSPIPDTPERRIDDRSQSSFPHLTHFTPLRKTLHPLDPIHTIHRRQHTLDQQVSDHLSPRLLAANVAFGRSPRFGGPRIGVGGVDQ